MFIYNTMSRSKEQFNPIKPNRVKLFVCGPTVYDDSHIGHGRTYIAFDCIARFLRYQGYSLFYLQNITDVDDKVIKRAREKGTDPLVLAREYERRYLADMKALGVKNVNLYARATEHVPEIIVQIKILLEKGFAYETETGVYFEESKFPDFGKLSRRKLEDLTVHRVDPDPSKRSPGDFALWKKIDKQPSWDSPWGRGRPGWHIEDTAITEEYFGSQYDIHGGGLDLIFPHHEAEIAQMESASGLKPMVRCWMHTGFLNVKGEKMSKSLGNFITIRELLQRWDGDVFRFLVLSTHYRSPIDFGEEALIQAHNSLERVRKTLKKLDELLKSNLDDEGSSNVKNIEIWDEAHKKFIEAMEDDFNTPQALSVLFEIVRNINRQMQNEIFTKSSITRIKILFEEWGEILGINFLPGEKQERTDDVLNILLDVRNQLREKKEWELSDKIRSQLKDLGFGLEDN
ncbi:cysteine--tRNA ligase [Methanobacterium sp. CWC-01]|uniref:cysteine--tRNA ligase n=1 Tax=Methanobacterium aridiramus TaxID=2584467 RepID=UPI002574C5C0|nr:cysteine--tRNA ligase [Methanobacterium sp. CWC-01]